VSAELVILGCGSIVPHPGRGPAGYALRLRPGGEVCLLDPGPGTIRRLAPCGISLEEVRRVFVTHFHPDHCLDLFAILFARRNPRLERGVPPLEIVGPPGLSRLLRAGEGMFGGWVRDPKAQVREVEPGEHPFEGFRLSAAKTHHTDHALAFRFDLAGGRSFAYSGDSPEHPDLSRLVAGVDLFLCECSFPDDLPCEGHLTPAQAGRLAAAAGVRRLLLTHFYPECDGRDLLGAVRAVFGGTAWLAGEGDRFAI
jgi:ribonuclease BN (tRNA processing enzyme)